MTRGDRAMTYTRRMIPIALLAALLGGCVVSDKPLLPESEAVTDASLTGRYLGVTNGRPRTWTVTLNGSRYTVRPGKEEARSATLHKFDDRFWLVQLAAPKNDPKERAL